MKTVMSNEEIKDEILDLFDRLVVQLSLEDRELMKDLSDEFAIRLQASKDIDK